MSDIPAQLSEPMTLMRTKDVKHLADHIEELEAKLASVIAAYRIEAMRREDYSHEAFDQHIAELKGEDRV